MSAAPCRIRLLDRALIAYLTVVCRLPRLVVQRLLADVLQIPRSLGSTQHAWEEASAAVAAPYKELRQALANQPVLNADETGHRTNGATRWLWTLVAPTFVFYTIATSRAADVLRHLLGTAFAGVLGSAACSSRISKSRNSRWLTRFAAVEARSSHRAMVWRAWPVTRAVADMLTPSTRRLATWSHSLRAQRRPLYAVPVCVLTVPPQTVQRYRQRRPHFVGNEPWPTMLRPSFPRLSHPRLAQVIPSIACIAQVYLGGTRGFRPRSRR